MPGKKTTSKAYNNPRRRRSGGSRKTWICSQTFIGVLKEDPDRKLITRGLLSIVPSKSPFRILSLKAEFSINGSTANTDGNNVIRSACAQLEVCSPVAVAQTTQAAPSYTTGPILIPLIGIRRHTLRCPQSQWWPEDISNSEELGYVTSLCFMADTATVSIAYIVTVKLQVRQPSFDKTCPTMSLLAPLSSLSLQPTPSKDASSSPTTSSTIARDYDDCDEPAVEQ